MGDRFVNSHSAPATVFALALAARLLVFWAGPATVPARALDPDSTRYLTLADNLLHTGVFGKAQEEGLLHVATAKLQAANGTLPPADKHGLRPEAYRTPGYPLFLARIDAYGGDLRTVLVVQNLLDAALAWLVIVLTQAAGVPRRGALLAGLAWALHPALIVYDNFILTETLFNVFCLVALAVAVFARSIWGWTAAGLLLGVATLIRPVGLLYLPAAVALVATGTSSRWRAALVMAVYSVLLPGLWVVRNHAHGYGWRLSTIGELHMLYKNAALVISQERGEDWLVNWPDRVRELSAKLGERLQPGENVYAAGARLAAEEVSARPRAFAIVCLKSQVKLFSDHSLLFLAQLLGVPYVPSGLYSRLVLREASPPEGASSDWLVAALAWMSLNLLIAGSAALGALVALWRRRWRLLVVGALTVALFAAATGVVGLERLRVPMIFPLLVLAAYAWTGFAAVTEPPPAKPAP